MKIVFLSDDFPPHSFGGAGFSTYELAKAMRMRGHHVSVITTCRSKADAGEFEFDGLSVFRIETNYPERWRAWRGLYNPGPVREVDKILSRLRPDVVHANNVHQYLSWAALGAAKKHAKRVVWTARDSMSYAYGKAQPGVVSWKENARRAGKRYNPLRNTIIRHYLSYADTKCAVSNALKEALEQNGIGKVRAVHTGIDASSWQVSAQSVADFKVRHGLAGKKIVLVAGRLSAGKGERQAREALAILRKDEPDAVLLAAGTPQGGEGVVATGWLDGEEKIAAYGAADAVWVPSAYLDPLPRVVLEAMVMGKPVVGTNLGGAPEAIVHDTTGFIVNPNDAQAWAQKTRMLLADPALARKMGAAGLARIKEHFALEDMARTYEGLYERAAVVFGNALPRGLRADAIVAPAGLRQEVESSGARFVELGSLVGPGSIYEAGQMLDRLVATRDANGEPVRKLSVYKGYELWWTHYPNIYYYFALPYTQYKPLLEYVSGFGSVVAYDSPYKSLFECHLRAHGTSLTSVSTAPHSPALLPFGIVVQLVLMLASLPVLVLRRACLLVYIGDKFAEGRDHDFRMIPLYGALRKRREPFVECIRSLEPWRVVLHNALRRRRAVLYSQPALMLGRLMRHLTGDETHIPMPHDLNSQERFEFLVSTWYARTIREDMYAVAIMKALLRLCGVRAAYITAASERSFPTVIACKLLGVPTVGIMHGMASRYSTPYDFLPGFDGDKVLSVDRYGVWSEWWKERYERESDAYEKEQLVVSGPMRPLSTEDATAPRREGPVRVLMISEQSAAKEELVPYLEALMESSGVELTVKFRPYRDGFEEWLKGNRPDILEKLTAVRGNMQDAVARADVVVASHSTGGLEAFLQLRPAVFFNTRKFGDFYGFKESEETEALFAENPKELVVLLQGARATPNNVLERLRERYFGDPRKNGSEWVADELLRMLGR